MSVVPSQIPVSTSVPALTLNAGTTGGVAIANSIDPANDYVLIYTASATATQGINRNTYLGLSSQPLGKTDVQTGISNKTFVAPVLGAATATSINGLTLTAESTGFQIVGGTTSKTLAINNSLTLAGTDSTTMTFPGSSDTVATLSATQTLTAKTLTSPAIGTSILDTNGNNLFAITATTSAVNYLTYKNAATTGAPTFTAAGSDTNINIALTAKGTGFIQGTPPVWQYLNSAQITNGSQQSTVSTTPQNITGLSVTVTVPTGVTKVRCSFYGIGQTSGSNSVMSFTIGLDGTSVQAFYMNNAGTANGNWPVSFAYISTPTAGSHTYTGQFSGDGTNKTSIESGSTITAEGQPGPAFILVECC